MEHDPDWCACKWCQRRRRRQGQGFYADVQRLMRRGRAGGGKRGRPKKGGAPSVEEVLKKAESDVKWAIVFVKGGQAEKVDPKVQEAMKEYARRKAEEEKSNEQRRTVHLSSSQHKKP